jgi:hypothetical protein
VPALGWRGSASDEAPFWELVECAARDHQSAKVRRFNVRIQGIAGMDGPVADPHRSRLDP